MPNDDKEKQKAKASDAAKQAMKDAAKRKENLDRYNGASKSTTYSPDKGVYESTPMKNAAIDYIKSKEMYK
jgi:hypothetical protein